MHRGGRKVRGPRDIMKTSNKKRNRPKQEQEDEGSSHKKLKSGLADVDSQQLTYENQTKIQKSKNRADSGILAPDTDSAVDKRTNWEKKKQRKIKKEEEKKKKKKKEEVGGEKKKKTKTKKNKEGENGEDEKEAVVATVTVTGKNKAWGCLSAGTGFIWEVPETHHDHRDSSNDEEVDSDTAKTKKVKKQSKAERAASAREEEQRLHQLECERLLDHRTPQSSLDYEELLQRSPNSSALWIQFISFHLESAEMDQAKSVARRALQVIDMQEEEERLNLWTVLLRLEVTYGTPEDAVRAYKEAQATNDQLKVHMAMAMVYAEAGKMQEAEKVYYVMSKKFGKVLDVWVKAGVHFFSHNKAEEGRCYMDRALLSLDKKQHVDLINRFGQLEFRFGEAERGRTMFESLLSSYPRRIDIWSVYVDLLAKRGDHEGARHILERMTGLKLRLRKMRFVFKKFLEFEKEHGSSQSVETVKKRVEEFVSSILHHDA